MNNKAYQYTDTVPEQLARTEALLAFNDLDYLPVATELLVRTSQLGNCALYGTINRLTTQKLTHDVQWIAEHNYGYNVTVIDMGNTKTPGKINDGLFDIVTERAMHYEHELIVLQDIDMLLRNQNDTVQSNAQKKAASSVLNFITSPKAAKVAAISKAPHPTKQPNADIHPWMEHFKENMPFRGDVINPIVQNRLGRAAIVA
jgi:phage antirepressor YoqD-like protein